MTLNKNNIVKQILCLPFPKNSFWLVMGGALVMHGVRESTQDIDIGCDTYLFDALKSKGFTVVQSRSGKEKIEYSSIVHVYRNWLVNSVELIENVPVADLESIMKDKQRFGRPKDLDDIMQIKKVLNKYD